VHGLAEGTRGSADLCAYFFLRAFELLRDDGGLGLIATNTIAQGDTREVGLDRITETGGRIARAVPSQKWPGDANLEVACVWLRRSDWHGAHVLDGQMVKGIGPYLVVPGKAVGKPYRLAANAGKSFQGSNVLGLGFTMSEAEANALIDKDPRNKEVLFPYLNGKDLNSSPTQSPSRWVINFHDWPLEKAEEYPDCIAIVRAKVKPQRDRLADGDATARDRARRWWQFARPTMALYEAIKGMDRVIAATLVTKYLSFSPVSAQYVFAHKLAIIADSNPSVMGILSSSVFDKWTRRNCSTLETRLNFWVFCRICGSIH